MTWNNPSLLPYLWDGLMVGVCLVDQEGMITDMNATGSRILGWGAICPSQLSFHEVFDGSEIEGENSASHTTLLNMLKEKKMVWIPRTRCVVVMGCGVGWN